MQNFSFSEGYAPSNTFAFSAGVFVASTDFEFSGATYTPSLEFKFSEVVNLEFDCTLDVILDNPTIAGTCTSGIASNGILSTTLDTPLLGSLVSYVLPFRLAQIRSAKCVTVDGADNLNIINEYNIDGAERVDGEILISQNTAMHVDTETCHPIESLINVGKPCVKSVQEFAHNEITTIHYINEQAEPLNDSVIHSEQSNAQVYLDSWCMVREQGIFLRDHKTCSPIQDMAVPIVEDLKPVNLPHVSPNEYIPSSQFTYPRQANAQDYSFEFNFGVKGFLSLTVYRGLLKTVNCYSRDQGTKTLSTKCIPYEDAEDLPFGVTPFVDDPRDPVDPIPPTGSIYIVPVQEVYTMLNTISTTTSDLTPISLGSTNMAFDVDSHSWTFSSQLLDPSQRTLVTQNPDGSAKIIYITLNGYTWHMLVERIQVRKRFGEESISISGRGISALLGAPYQPVFSVTQSSVFTNQQLAESLLPVGWTLVWELPTWNVDSGAFSVQNTTPIDALSKLVKDCGGMLIPSRDSQSFTAKPRYPVLPWNFSSVAANIAIPSNVIIEMNEEPTARYDTNGVYVHGHDIGGELAFVRLNGTAGDKLAETTSNQLMTDVVGLRSLGERILAGAQEQPLINSVTSFMDGNVMPIVDMGLLVEFTVDAQSIKGITNGISISVSENEILQTFTIGEATTNTFTLFKEILPADPLLVGTVNSTSGQTSLVSLIDGGVVRVRGVGSIGQKYYIRSGELSTAAPNLTSSTIVV